MQRLLTIMSNEVILWNFLQTSRKNLIFYVLVFRGQILKLNFVK